MLKEIKRQPVNGIPLLIVMPFAIVGDFVWMIQSFKEGAFAIGILAVMILITPSPRPPSLAD